MNGVCVDLFLMEFFACVCLCVCVMECMCFSGGDKLVDFEAMTTPSPDGFSKTAKSWMNLKR